MNEQTSSTGQQPSYMPTSDEKTLAILSHILTIVVGFLAPLIIYLVKKDESKYVADHAKESLNFQITVTLVCILLFITIIGALLVWVVIVAMYVFVIIATINANDNKLYRYPVNIRFIK